ncbi:hypothetical protein VIBNISOn1_270010 [Vibrio nigripulchritudo SOn1]|uniref:Transposase n=1 Tax=Vibrio nigripulchritudo SOn1 TaxID=1238450 RepID=A0AAV2VRA2_9VIBR|nr:hypothetical protein VIBNISOn1_270010 [Vibrio nigripulchritudo SOn1]
MWKNDLAACVYQTISQISRESTKQHSAKALLYLICSLGVI